MKFFAGRGRGRDNGVVRARERDDERRQRLGELMLVSRAVRDQHLLDAVELRGGIGDRAAAFAGDQHMHVAAERLGGGQRLVGRILERLVVVLGNQKNSHPSTPASFSLPTSSATEPTLAPALRPPGSTVFTTSAAASRRRRKRPASSRRSAFSSPS